MPDNNSLNKLDSLSKGELKFKNPNIIIKGKKIKNSELKSIVKQLRDDPKLNDGIILDFFLDLDSLIEKNQAKITDLLQFTPK